MWPRKANKNCSVYKGIIRYQHRVNAPNIAKGVKFSHFMERNKRGLRQHMTLKHYHYNWLSFALLHSIITLCIIKELKFIIRCILYYDASWKPLPKTHFYSRDRGFLFLILQYWIFFELIIFPQIYTRICIFKFQKLPNFCFPKKNPLRDIVETAKINLVWAELKIIILWLYCKKLSNNNLNGERERERERENHLII